MLKGTALLVLLNLLATPQGQDPPALESRLDSATVAELRPILESARRDSVPIGALENKALEGAAKRVPSMRIVAAVRALADELRETRAMLRAAAPSAVLTDGEIVAAVEVQRRGVPADHVSALRRSAPPSAALEIPLAVLGALVERGVPVEQARGVVEHLVLSGVEQDKLIELPSRLDAALRVGAPPVPALGSALAGLGIPSPPLQPPPPAPRRPDRGRG